MLGFRHNQDGSARTFSPGLAYEMNLMVLLVVLRYVSPRTVGADVTVCLEKDLTTIVLTADPT